MFERITLDRQGLPNSPIDLGTLAECLLFYGKVRVIVDQVSFAYLVRKCGAEELLHLQSMGLLELEYFENVTAVLSNQIGDKSTYDIGNVGSSVLRYQSVARKLFDDLAGPSGKGANKFFNKFDRQVKRSEYTSEMAAEARLDWSDAAYTTEAARSLLRLLAPAYALPDPLEFRMTQTNRHFHLSSNIDFDAANVARNTGDEQADGTVSPGNFLARIAHTRYSLTVGSRFSSEFALSPIDAMIASCKFSQIVASSIKGLSSTDLFQEEVIDGLPRIRDAVNEGAKTFAEVIELVERAHKFKDWLAKHPDEDMRKSYLSEVSHVDWADKMPNKSLRFLLFAAAGLAIDATCNSNSATAAGLALGAADSLLLDQFIKGWKPNQFIEGPLKQFLNVKLPYSKRG